MTGSFVTFRDVVREYNTDYVSVRAADGISFTLEKGKFSVIVGPSGAGKTTVLNILGGMETVTSGNVIVDDCEITKLSEREITNYRRDDVGFVFQFYNLIQNLTALENVELASYIRKDALDPRVILAEVGLADRINHFPAQLSGGEQQRVAIARALAKNPKLLLCDEPTGALDYETSRGVLSLIEDINTKYGTTILMITHNSAIAGMAHAVFRLRGGEVVETVHNAELLPAERIEW